MISKRRKHSDWPYLIGPVRLRECSEAIGIVEWMAR